MWYTMGRRMDKHGNMIDTSPKVGEMSNTNTDRAFLLLMLTISSPPHRDQRGWYPRLGVSGTSWAPHQPVFDPRDQDQDGHRLLDRG